MRILVVEDDSYLAEGVSRSLCKSGHAVDVVADGLSAEAALGVTSYDLVILDLQLPQRNGLEVLRNYRAGGGHAPGMILQVAETLVKRHFLQPCLPLEARGRKPLPAEFPRRQRLADRQCRTGAIQFRTRAFKIPFSWLATNGLWLRLENS
jgi:CheY-like chemotaxis protein